MRAGDIVFFHGKGIVSWLIRKVTNGRFNHSAIAISDKLVLESEWNSGVRIRNIEAYEKEGAIIEVVPMYASMLQVSELHKICNSHVSAKFYDWKQIGKLLLKYVFHISLKKRNTRERVICSELCAMVLLDCGMTMDYDIIEFSPQELYDWLVGEEDE